MALRAVRMNLMILQVAKVSTKKTRMRRPVTDQGIDTTVDEAVEVPADERIVVRRLRICPQPMSPIWDFKVTVAPGGTLSGVSKATMRLPPPNG